MTAGGAPGPRAPFHLRSGLWLALTLVTVLVVQLVPVLFYSRYFFVGDTQNAYYPWWWELGTQLRQGHWPILDPQGWATGNHLAEGQWGLFSPLTMLIGLGATVCPSSVGYVLLVKTVLTLVGAAGAFRLARSYRCPPTVAYVLAVSVPLTSATQFLDWPSWTATQMATALLPWAWLGLRRILYDGAAGWMFLVAGYLLVTIGYVYGTLYLGVVIVGCLVEGALHRRLAQSVRILVLSAACGLVAAAVYLPGVLTARVTIRNSSSIVPVGPMQGDIGRLLTASVPVQSSLLSYVAWFLPLLVWVDPRRLRPHWRGLSGAAVMTVVMTLWLLGPNQLGPIRWPARNTSVFALFLLVLVVVVLLRGVRLPVSRGRLLLSLGVGALLVYARLPGDWARLGWVFLGGGIALVSIGVVWLLSRRLALPGLLVALAATVAVSGLSIQVVQHHLQPRPTAVDRHSPSNVAGYRQQLPRASGDVFLVGDPQAPTVKYPRAGRELLVAAAWYLNPHPVANGYTTISFRSYRARFCMYYNGETCPKALDHLFAKDPTTGRTWADLMSVSTVAIVRDSGIPESRWRRPPTGWRLAQVQEFVVTWVRDRPLPSAGSVTWSSDGVAVSDVVSSPREVRFRVDAAPASGGDVVLSRLAWPGYQVTGATFATPLADTLLTVHLDGSRPGDTVTVRFSPPHWAGLLLAWWLGVVGGLACCAVVTGRRMRRAGRRAAR